LTLSLAPGGVHFHFIFAFCIAYKSHKNKNHKLLTKKKYQQRLRNVRNPQQEMLKEINTTNCTNDAQSENARVGRKEK